MNKALLNMLVCPICKGNLEYRAEELICYIDKLAFSIENSVININQEQARELTLEDIKNRPFK